MTKLRPPRWNAFIWVCFGLLAAIASAQTPTPSRPPEANLSQLNSEAHRVYYTLHERDRGLALFEELEAEARAQKNWGWTWHALWKQGQVWGDRGDLTKSIACFERSLSELESQPSAIGSASHLLLLGNLGSTYHQRGQMAEALKVHWRSESALRVAFSVTLQSPVEGSIYAVSDADLAKIDGLGPMMNPFIVEAAFRFEAGNDEGAVELARRVERQFAASRDPNDLVMRSRSLVQVAEHLDAMGKTEEAVVALTKLLRFAGPRQYDTSTDSYEGRVHLAWLNLRLGLPPEPQFTDARAAIATMKERLKTESWTTAQATLARMLAHEKNFPEAFAVLDAAISNTRSLDEPRLLAALLVTRAELRLDSGVVDGVEPDLFEALKAYRRMGNLRAETDAHVQYLRLLRASRRFDEARTVLAETNTRLARFREPRLIALVAREAAALVDSQAAASGAAPAVRPPSSSVATTAAPLSDVQPLQLTTRVAPGERATARFTITNPSAAPVSGSVGIAGAGGRESWNTRTLTWTVDLAAAAPAPPMSRAITVPPYEQATLLLNFAPPSASPVELTLTWTTANDTNTTWWRVSADDEPAEISVLEASLALENPFYCVALHHTVRYRGNLRAVQDLRVTTSEPARVEILDATGAILAVDATGDGRFDGEGDILFADSDRSGFPDLRLDRENPEQPVELLIYPADPRKTTEVSLALRERDQRWRTHTLDRLLAR